MLLCIALTFIGAIHMTSWFCTLPFNMPYWLERAIRFGFRLFVNDDMPDPEDDIAPVAVLFYLACANLIVGTAVYFAASAIWRRHIAPRFTRH
jgi:hypothetical protein